VAQDEADGGRIQAHVERVQDRARHGHAVVGLEHRRGVGRHDRDGIARADAARDQRRGQAPAARVGLGPAPAQRPMDHRRVVGEHLGRARQEAERAERRIVGPVPAELAAVVACAIGHAALPVGAPAFSPAALRPPNTQM
jgi:hypothetical protein